MLQNLFSYICWIIIVFLQTSKCRRYDIEQEAQNLYSTDLRSVMERFRRTPEYLKILDDYIDSININIDAIMDSTAYYYANKLEEKVNQNFGGNETNNLRTIQQIHLKKILRKPRKKIQKNRKNQGDDKGLDDYKKFHSSLSLEQKNHMKELGFEYAGDAIHAIISSILPDGALPTSTLLPYGGNSAGTSSTIHHHNHEVTHHTLPGTETTETSSLSDTTASD